MAKVYEKNEKQKKGEGTTNWTAFCNINTNILIHISSILFLIINIDKEQKKIREIIIKKRTNEQKNGIHEMRAIIIYDSKNYQFEREIVTVIINHRYDAYRVYG